jgi:hypothetical protein
VKPAREIGQSWRGRVCPGLRDCPERSVQVAKAWSAAEAQVEAIAALGLEAPDKAARALAIMVRTLKELAAIDAEAARLREGLAMPRDAAAGVAQEPRAFHDLDTLREELARRLRACEHEGEAPLPRGP